MGGNFINNRNLSATVQAEGNDFGTNNREEILGKIGGNTDFEPRYTTGETDLVFDLVIDVSESASATSTPVTDAVVRLQPNVGLPTEIESGRYVFQSVPFQSYVISVSATNYQSAQVSLTDADNSGPLVVILETDQGGVEFSAISVSLTLHFDTLDLDSNGALSISEARAEVPKLSQSQFDTLDTNGDGQLSDIEIAAQVGEGEGEGEGETPTGCPASKSDLISGIRNAFGDMFLMGLGLMAVLAYGRFSRRASASTNRQ